MNLEHSLRSSSDLSLATGIKTALIVEDDGTLRLLWINIFRKLSLPFRLEWVTSAEDFERSLWKKERAQQHYDLVICDIFLSGPTTGLDLWRRHAAKQFFLLTSAISQKKLDHMLSHDVEQRPIFLAKPLDPTGCVDIIEHLLHYGERKEPLEQ